MNENRKSFTENDKLILFSEVNSVCPNCPNTLMYKKNKKNYKRFEIAHIYPLNPKPEELIVLKFEEKLSVDPNNLDNLICLCVDCHTKFDKPRTIDEYKKLSKLKKRLIKKNKEKDIWNNTKLESEIFQLLDFLSNEEFNISSEDILNYDPKTIDSKINESITYLTKRSIHRNVQEYYAPINQKFSELDKISPLTTETISAQIRTQYLTLSKQLDDRSQKEIFDGMVDWLEKVTHQQSKEAATIVISYFIQNCEVFK